MKELIDYLATWDPMGFIEELGAPKDEYSLEAETLRQRYTSDMDEKQVGKLTYDIFVELVELKPKSFREDALKRGIEIKAILDQK